MESIMKRKKAILSVILALLVIVLPACNSQSDSATMRTANDASDYAIRAVFGYGDEVDQLMWVMSPTITNDPDLAATTRSDYEALMQNYVAQGYQYCDYRCDGSYKLDKNSTEYNDLGAVVDDSVKSVTVCCYTVKHSEKSQDLSVLVYVGKISSNWYVLCLKEA